MYATLRELEERQLLSIRKEEDGSQKIENPLDLMDQEKLLSDLERKKSLFMGRIHEK